MNGDSEIKFSGKPRFMNKNKPPADDDNAKGFSRAQTAPGGGDRGLNASAKPFTMARDDGPSNGTFQRGGGFGDSAGKLSIQPY